MSFKAGKIFDERIFGNNAFIMSRFKNTDNDPDEANLITGEINDISAFDYILAQRLGVFPFDEENIYWDWTGYESVSIPTLRKFHKNHMKNTVEHLVYSVPVHQDLFFTMSFYINTENFFLALFFSPQPYRILCMQWDSYYELYQLYAGKIEKIDNFQDVNRRTKKIPHLECIHTCNEDISSADEHVISTTDDYNTLLSYAKMVSDLGIRDIRKGLVIGPICKNNADYNRVWNSLTQDHPSILPYLMTSETFFSNIAGL